MRADDRPLRIALLAYRGKPHVGGQGVYVRHLSKALVDLGHHAPNTNVEMIVARLIQFGKLGGFHFNDSKYGDDDLDSGAIHPYQLFLIVSELLHLGDGAMPGLAYMIDASHNIKDPLEDLIQSTEAVSIAYAQARRSRGSPRVCTNLRQEIPPTSGRRARNIGSFAVMSPRSRRHSICRQALFVLLK